MLHVARQSRLRGFTLVELLVVIGIIALLVAVLLPAIHKARSHANTVRCATAIREMANGFFGFANNNRGYSPGSFSPLATGAKSWVDVLNGEWFKSNNHIAAWIGPGAKLYCPETMTAGGSRGIAANYFVTSANVTDKTGLRVTDPDRLSYLTGYYQAAGIGTGGGMTRYDYGTKLTRFRDPARSVLIMEISGTSNDTQANNPLSKLGFRHPTLRMNVAFIDGHVESIAWNANLRGEIKVNQPGK